MKDTRAKGYEAELFVFFARRLTGEGASKWWIPRMALSDPSL
jgi:hypothetical protein